MYAFTTLGSHSLVFSLSLALSSAAQALGWLVVLLPRACLPSSAVRLDHSHGSFVDRTPGDFLAFLKQVMAPRSSRPTILVSRQRVRPSPTPGPILFSFTVILPSSSSSSSSEPECVIVGIECFQPAVYCTRPTSPPVYGEVFYQGVTLYSPPVPLCPQSFPYFCVGEIGLRVGDPVSGAVMTACHKLCLCAAGVRPCLEYAAYPPHPPPPCYCVRTLLSFPCLFRAKLRVRTGSAVEILPSCSAPSPPTPPHPIPSRAATGWWARCD